MNKKRAYTKLEKKIAELEKRVAALEESVQAQPTYTLKCNCSVNEGFDIKAFVNKLKTSLQKIRL